MFNLIAERDAFFISYFVGSLCVGKSTHYNV